MNLFIYVYNTVGPSHIISGYSHLVSPTVIYVISEALKEILLFSTNNLCNFVYLCLFKDAVTSKVYIASNNRIINDWIINWKGYERKQSWPNLRYYYSMEVLKKTIKNLSKDSKYLGQNLNQRPLEYKAGVLTTRPQHSVYSSYKSFSTLLYFPINTPFVSVSSLFLFFFIIYLFMWKCNRTLPHNSWLLSFVYLP
jgi:hypothetical protein